MKVCLYIPPGSYETTGKANLLLKVKQKKPIYGHWDKMMKAIQSWVQRTSSNKEK